MKHFRSPDHLKRAALAGDYHAARALLSPRQPADLSAILDFLPKGGSPRMDPTAAHEIVSSVLRAMELSFLPQPASTVESHARCYHQDLPNLSDQALWQELSRAGFLLAWCERAQWHPWVLERSQRCQQELQRRRQGGRHAR
jgi:hypothetical protein